MLPVGDGITLCRRIKWGAAFPAYIIYIYQMLTIDLVTCKNKWCVIKEILPTLLIFCTWKNGEWPRNSILEFLSGFFTHLIHIVL
jgi:hypothetical protein